MKNYRIPIYLFNVENKVTSLYLLRFITKEFVKDQIVITLILTNNKETLNITLEQKRNLP